MIYNLDLFGIGDAIVQALRSGVGWLAAMIYTLIEYMYHVFELLGRAEIIRSDFVQTIYSRVGMLLGIFMIFKLVFSLVQSLIEPEKLNDKKDGYAQIIKRCVISIVLLGVTPSLFREAFKIQNLIVGGSAKDNVIYKLVSVKSTHSSDLLGRQLAGNLYFDFVTDEKDPILSNGMLDDYVVSSDGSLESGSYINRFVEDNWDNVKENIINGVEGKGFSDTIDYLAIKEGGKYVIELNWFPLLVVGAIVLYMISVYCIQTGIRVVQLAYLQLIAPVPILSYISDPEGSFKKWVKQCVTTYLDLFIRLAIIYFVMAVIADVLDQLALGNVNGIINESAGLANENWLTIVLVKAFIIIGLLLFAKKVPELLKDLFPNLGGGAGKFSFGLGLKNNLFDPLKDVGKSLYNSPVGWGLKGAKAIGTVIDRKRYNLPKTRNKFGQAMDKWLPGRGEAIKQRNQAKADERQFNKNMDQGKKIYNRFGEDLVLKDSDGKITSIKSGVFSNRDYEKSYLDLEKAKADNKKASDEYQTVYAQYQAAYNKGDQAAIDLAEERIKIADKNKKIAQGKVDLAQKKHDANKKIYSDDAQREERYDYYKKTHGQFKEYPTEPSSYPQSSSSSQTVQSQPQSQTAASQENVPINSQNSMFANMSDSEWQERQSQNNREEYASKTDPNDFFDKLDQNYADEYLKNNGVSDDFDKNYNTSRKNMEDAYKKAGWSQDKNGKWTKNNGS